MTTGRINQVTTETFCTPRPKTALQSGTRHTHNKASRTLADGRPRFTLVSFNDTHHGLANPRGKKRQHPADRALASSRNVLRPAGSTPRASTRTPTETFFLKKNTHSTAGNGATSLTQAAPRSPIGRHTSAVHPPPGGGGGRRLCGATTKGRAGRTLPEPDGTPTQQTARNCLGTRQGYSACAATPAPHSSISSTA